MTNNNNRNNSHNSTLLTNTISHFTLTAIAYNIIITIIKRSVFTGSYKVILLGRVNVRGMSRMRRGRSWGSCVSWIRFWEGWLGGRGVVIGGWDRLSVGRQRNCRIDVSFSTTFRTMTTVISILLSTPASHHPCSLPNPHPSTPQPFSPSPVHHRYPLAPTLTKTHRRSFQP